MQHVAPGLISGEISSRKISAKGEGEILFENGTGFGKKGWVQ